MAVDPVQAMTSGPVESAPKMLRRPADAPPPLAAVRDGEHLRSLHMAWARLYGSPGDAAGTPSRLQRMRHLSRQARALGRANRELLSLLIHTVDAIALRCDELADRLAAQEGLMEDITVSFGEDITRLRAELLRAHTVLPFTEPPLP
jgi:hypothetical protein